MSCQSSIVSNILGRCKWIHSSQVKIYVEGRYTMNCGIRKKYDDFEVRVGAFVYLSADARDCLLVERVRKGNVRENQTTQRVDQ